MDVGCICGRARVCADASLENWRRGGLTMDQPADVARTYEQRTHGTREGEGEGRIQGPRRNITSSGRSGRLVKAKPRPRFYEVFWKRSCPVFAARGYYDGHELLDRGDARPLDANFLASGASKPTIGSAQRQR